MLGATGHAAGAAGCAGELEDPSARDWPADSGVGWLLECGPDRLAGRRLQAPVWRGRVADRCATLAHGESHAPLGGSDTPVFRYAPSRQHRLRPGTERMDSSGSPPIGGYVPRDGDPDGGGRVAVTDRVPSDNPSVDSYGVTLGSVGSTNRPQLVLPAELCCERGEFVRLVTDEDRAHAEVVSTLDGSQTIRAAYPDRATARSGDGPDLFGRWLDDHDVGPGDTVVVDVLTEGYAYGLREPGERIIYEPPRRPDSSLADIAESLEE